MTPPLLSIDRVHVRFGGITALDGVTFELPAGKITGLIGPNGAGKTTLFNCISRLYPVREGDIRFEGRSILKLPPHRICARGIGRTFQNLALFETMTVLDNVLVGGHRQARGDFPGHALRLPGVRGSERQLREKAVPLIEELGLTGVVHRRVSDLPLGTQKRVELARALMSSPKLLLLDEPAGGLNHEEAAELVSLIRALRDQHGLTLLLVEHHMGLVMAVSDLVIALNFGRKIAAGTPDEVQQHPEVIKAYLGTAH